MESFGNELRKLLLEKIKLKKVNLSEARIRNLKLVYQEVDGNMRYFLDQGIIDELSTEDRNEIEELWSRSVAD